MQENLQDLAAKVAALLKQPQPTNHPFDPVEALASKVAALLKQQRDDEVISARQFCEEQGFKLSYFYKLKSEGRAPRMIARNRMTRRAVREWQISEQEYWAGAAWRLAYERQRVRCKKAAAVSVTSAKHPHPKGSGKNKSRNKK